MRLSLPQLGMTVGLISLTFFFVALMLAFGLRIDAQTEWRRFNIPHLLWVGTVVLVLSSITVEFGRYALRRALVAVYRSRLLIAVVLAVLFLVLQGISAADLLHQGVAVSGNPRGSAFYVFMSIHGAHLLAGALWLAYLLVTSRRLFEGTEQDLRRHRRTLAAAVSFWHFMGLLWIVMFWFLRRWATAA